MANAPNAAMLIDFDNVTMGIRSELLQVELKNLLSSDVIKGKVSVRRAYADWRRYPQYIVPLTEASIDLIFAPAYGSAKKNATDIRLAIDALELVFTRPEIGTFVLLSGDSDFSSMVIKLKEYGKYVIGVGIRESASDLLVMNCDEYYSYNALAGLTKSGEDESTRWDPWELVTEAIGRMKRNGDVMRSDRLKQVMQEIDSSFDEKDLGMPKFSRFVQDAAHRGLLRTTKLDNGQLEVDVALDANVGSSTDAPVMGTTAGTVTDGEPDTTAEVRRDRPERERDDRRGRRGRRGRGRDREHREDEPRDDTHEGEPQDDEGIAAASNVATTDGSTDNSVLALTSTFSVPPKAAPVGRAAFTPAFTPSVTPPAPIAAPASTPAPLAAHASPFGDTATDNIGRGGERLTRMEAFDLVRRAVEALVSGEETTSASAVREKAFAILGRDSESLSGRNFERILRDSHDADMIDLRRRGNDFEIARAADAAPIVEQLQSAEAAHKAAAAANAPPPPPRGMSHRGVGGRSKNGRGAPAPIDPSMLMMGVVGTPKTPAAPAVSVADSTSATPVAKAAAAPAATLAATSPAEKSAAREPTAKPADRRKSGGRGATSARKNAAPAAKAAEVPSPKTAKAPAKPATPAKVATPAKAAAPAKAAGRTAAKPAAEAKAGTAKPAAKKTARTKPAAGKTARAPKK